MGLDIDLADMAPTWMAGAQRSPGMGQPQQGRFDVATLRSGAFATVIVTGEACADQMASLLHVLGLQSGDWPAPGLLLIDLMMLRSAYTDAQLRTLGRELACSFAHMQRIAVVVPSQRITGIAERMARRHRLDLCVFDDLRRAQAWLHAGGACGRGC